jgi:hypothetical protein
LQLPASFWAQLKVQPPPLQLKVQLALPSQVMAHSPPSQSTLQVESLPQR